MKFKVVGKEFTIEELRERYNFRQFFCEDNGIVYSQQGVSKITCMGEEEKKEFEAELHQIETVTGEEYFEADSSKGTCEQNVLSFMLNNFEDSLTACKVGQTAILMVYDEDSEKDVRIGVQRVG